MAMGLGLLLLLGASSFSYFLFFLVGEGLMSSSVGEEGTERFFFCSFCSFSFFEQAQERGSAPFPRVFEGNALQNGPRPWRACTGAGPLPQRLGSCARRGSAPALACGACPSGGFWADSSRLLNRSGCIVRKASAASASSPKAAPSQAITSAE